MNWRRGFLRLWVVLSACWIVATTMVFRPDRDAVFLWSPVATAASSKSATGGNVFDQFDNPKPPDLPPGYVLDPPPAPSGKEGGIDLLAPLISDAWDHLRAFSVFAFLPPAAALILGTSLCWVAIGFSRRG